MGRFDRSDVDVAFRRLMAKENRSVAMEIGKLILVDTLEFWRQNCHVALEPKAIENIRECREFADLRDAFTWRRLGRVEGGESKRLHALAGDVRRKLSPPIRAKNRLLNEGLDVARVAMENLVLLRNVDDHTYDQIHDPGTVAAVAGTLLMLVEHAGNVEADLREAMGRLREDARTALDRCVCWLDPEDEAGDDSSLGAVVVEQPSTSGTAEALVRMENTIEAVRDVLTEWTDRSFPSPSTGAPEAGVVAGGSPQVEGTKASPVLAEVLSSVERLAARSLTESDLKYLISIAKPRRVDDADVERRLSELNTSLAALLDRVPRQEDVDGLVESLADRVASGLSGSDAVEAGSLTRTVAETVVDLGNQVTELAAVVESLDPTEPRAEGDGHHVAGNRLTSVDRVDLQAALVSLRERIPDEEKLRRIVSDALAGSGTWALPDPDWREVESPGAPLDHVEAVPDGGRPVLTLQQAENRLVSLRNRIKDAENIEWYECVLQRKFIRQMLDARICDRESWQGAGGPIQSWFEDERNDRKVMERQLEQYGEEIFEIMKSVDFGSDVDGVA